MRPPRSPPVSDSAVARVRPRSRSSRPTTASRVSSSVAVDDLAELLRILASTGAISARASLPGGADGGQADPDLARAGQVGHGDLAGHGLVPQGGEALGQARLPHPGGAQGPGDDRPALAGPGRQVGQDHPLEHALHLARDAGHGVGGLAADLDDQAGGGPPGVVDGAGALGHVGLAQVHLGHPLDAHAGEPLAQPGLQLRLAHQGHAGHLGQRLPGDVVLGRAQAAGQDHRVGPPERLGDRCRRCAGRCPRPPCGAGSPSRRRPGAGRSRRRWC